MKILHILKAAPDASTKRIIEFQSAGNQVTTVDLSKGGADYDKFVADVFTSDRVFCW